ncbi:MAG: PEP-CTERM sorting domain-containing protein [Planctomycetota bacterium]
MGLAPIFCASSASAINWNDVAVGTDSNIAGGSVYTLKAADLSTVAPAGQNPATGLGTVADVGFQTNRTPLPVNTPPGTFPGGPSKDLETVVWITEAGVATNANANRPEDKVLQVSPTGFTGSDLTVLGDDTVFLGGSGSAEGEIRDSGLLNPVSAAVGDGVVDSVWQKLPSDNVAVAYIDGGVGKLGIRDGDGSTVGVDATLPAVPVDVDIWRQNPTLVVATGTNTLSVYDGLTLSLLDTEMLSLTGDQEIVAISVLSDRSVAVALYDAMTDMSQIQIVDEMLDPVSSSPMYAYEITAMDNQNVIDTLIVGNDVGEVRMLDSSNYSELFLRSFGDGSGGITAITVNAPEPAAAALALLALAGCGACRRRG